jgi:hypothetical protein
MNDDRFNELMRDAERTYRNPPNPDFDAMWKSIEREQFGAPARPVQSRFFTNRWVGIAATLLIGIALGRGSMLINRAAPVTPASTTVAANDKSVTTRDTLMERPYELETSRYLGQTAALLVALPSEVKAGGTSAQFASRAGDLLTRTRLLMDSPAANDPSMRGLLDDLELVLMQVVRLQNSGNRTDLDLINRALEQREVIPRLRTAAADISAN